MLLNYYYLSLPHTVALLHNDLLQKTSGASLLLLFSTRCSSLRFYVLYYRGLLLKLKLSSQY